MWVALEAGRMTVRGRPSPRALAGLRADGCTHIVTLLSEKEGARELGQAIEAAGLGWIWIPLPNGTPPAGATRARVLAGLDEMIARLLDGGSLLVHCAAGIHRTGMIAYACMRRLGITRDDALARLGEMREHTRAGVGDDRLAWGDDVAALRDP